MIRRLFLYSWDEGGAVGSGVHESHRKRFCQGCYRFTDLPLPSQQPVVDEEDKAAPCESDASTPADVPRTSGASDKKSESESETATEGQGSNEHEVENHSVKKDEPAKTEAKKVSRKCTAQIWCERCRQSWYCSAVCKEQVPPPPPAPHPWQQKIYALDFRIACIRSSVPPCLRWLRASSARCHTSCTAITITVAIVVATVRNDCSPL